MVLQADPSLLDELTEVERRNVQQLTDVIPLWHAHDVQGILANYDENVLWCNVPAEETFTGKEAFRSYMQELFVGFPDYEFDVTHRVAHGNFVAERWYIRGTHRGAFMGIPPTNRRVNVPGMTLVEFRDGKFIRGEFYYDTGIMLRQLGLMPPLSVMQSRGARAFMWTTVKCSRGLRAVVSGAKRVVSRSR